MRWPLVFAFWAALLTSSHTTAQNTEKVVLGTLHYPPYIIKQPNGEINGFDIEVVREIFARMDVELKIDLYPWKRAIKNAINGLTAGVISCSPREQFHVSAPISTATDTLFVRSDHNFEKYPITSVQDLLKYPELKVGGVDGYKQLQLLDEVGIKYDRSADDTVAYKKLFAGRIDVLLSIEEYGKFQLKQLRLSNLAISIPLRQKLYHVCFSKSWLGIEGILKRFDATLTEVRNDGTFDAIHARYK